jgi:two-component system, LytTR family, response regulator
VNDKADLWIDSCRPEILVLRFVEFVEAYAGTGRIELHVECRGLDGLLFIAGQTGKAVRESVGNALLPKLQPLPAIIFVTACDEFAVRAFEVDAVDYLLKPVRPERLANALQRVVYSQKPAQTERLCNDDKVLLDADTEMRVVFIAEISAIAAEGNYTRVHLADGSSSFVRRGITQWDGVLPKPFFVWVDRSLIIRLQAVRKVVAQARDEVSVEVEGFSPPLPLRRRGSFRLRRALRDSKVI